MEADPYADADVYAASDPRQAALGARLEAYKAALVASDRSGVRSDPGAPSEADVEALRGLGYVQ